MIRKPKDWDNVKAFGQSQKLPKGAYICKIMGAEVIWNGDGIKVSYDIAEGDYKDFFKRDWDNNTNEDRKWRGVLKLTLPAGDGTEQRPIPDRNDSGRTDAQEHVHAVSDRKHHRVFRKGRKTDPG